MQDSAVVLAIDAATYAGSVAVIEHQVVRYEARVAMRGETEERLMPAVVEALAACGITPGMIDAVACGAGPGSFTSLRIAASIAKGLAASRGIPLLAASSLTLVVAGAFDLVPGDYLARLDAMRGDVFFQRLRLLEDGRVEERSVAALASREATDEIARAEGLVTVGAAGSQIPREPHARGFVVLIGHGASEVSLESWEPSYGRLAEAQVQWERRHGRALADR